MKLKAYLIGEVEKWRIKNGKEVEKWGIENILVFLHVVWFEECKRRGTKNSFFFVEKKNRRVENVVCVNLLLSPYFITYKNNKTILIY